VRTKSPALHGRRLKSGRVQSEITRPLKSGHCASSEGWRVLWGISDDEVLHLLKIILKADGKRGVPQGGVISAVLSNLYLNEVDQMLERARERTRRGK